MWLRQGRTPAIAVLGVLSLVGFAFLLTRVDASFAGRAYAASLAWLWGVEDQRPTWTDLLVALLAIGGAVVILSASAKRLP
jgi:small multidrug resistance family-3 protein